MATIKDSLRNISAAYGVESEAKSITGILSDICFAISGQKPTSKRISGILNEIADGINIDSEKKNNQAS